MYVLKDVGSCNVYRHKKLAFANAIATPSYLIIFVMLHSFLLSVPPRI